MPSAAAASLVARNTIGLLLRNGVVNLRRWLSVRRVSTVNVALPPRRAGRRTPIEDDTQVLSWSRWLGTGCNLFATISSFSAVRCRARLTLCEMT